MGNLVITQATTKKEQAELDQLLWDVLWKNLGFDRDIRQSFLLEGKAVELVAKIDGRVIGGLVANWTAGSEVEIRQIAVMEGFQGLGTGQGLVKCLVDMMLKEGYQSIKTVARQSSVEFFEKLGFRISPIQHPQHPVFMKHGIRFVVMENHQWLIYKSSEIPDFMKSYNIAIVCTLGILVSRPADY